MPYIEFSVGRKSSEVDYADVIRRVDDVTGTMPPRVVIQSRGGRLSSRLSLEVEDQGDGSQRGERSESHGRFPVSVTNV